MTVKFRGERRLACLGALLLIVVSLSSAAAAKKTVTVDIEQVLKLAQHANDIAEIQNIMGRYSHYAMANHWPDVGALYALKTPGVRYSAPFLVKDGAEAIKSYFDTRDDSNQQGVLQQHTMATPVIEIAGDGQTAKGVWDSPGSETATGESPAYWAWVKYGVDFIKEDGQWKIWHLKVYPTFRTAYNKSWVETAKDNAAAAATTPVNSNAPKLSTWVYNGKGTPPLEPKPPKPYQTFDPNDAYL